MSTKLTSGRAYAGKIQQSAAGRRSQRGGVYVREHGGHLHGLFVPDWLSVSRTSSSRSRPSAATSATISVGLATGASSAGVGNAYVNSLIVGTAGTYVLNASTSALVLAFNYGSYLIASSSASVTVLKSHVVGSTDTYLNLTYTTNTTAAISGVIYPLFHELA